MLLPALQLLQFLCGALYHPPYPFPSLPQDRPAQPLQQLPGALGGETEFELTWKSQGEQVPTLGMDPVKPSKIFYQQIVHTEGADICRRLPKTDTEVRSKLKT